jgi:hypothetical protein
MVQLFKFLLVPLEQNKQSSTASVVVKGLMYGVAFSYRSSPYQGVV